MLFRNKYLYNLLCIKFKTIDLNRETKYYHFVALFVVSSLFNNNSSTKECVESFSIILCGYGEGVFLHSSLFRTKHLPRWIKHSYGAEILAFKRNPLSLFEENIDLFVRIELETVVATWFWFFFVKMLCQVMYS